MRHRALIASLAAAVALSACSAGRGIDDFAPAPSLEITNSVKRPDAGLSSPVAQQLRPATREVAVEDKAPEPQINSLVEEQENDVVEASFVEEAKPIRKANASIRKIHAQRFRDAKPMNFGKSKPKHYPVHGVDVSRWQGQIDWAKLRSHGANFAYIKSTDGGDHLDPMFRTNWRAAKQAGLKRGAYHFFYWCRDAGSQAAWFIRNVPKDPEALPPVIDVEWNHLSGCKKRPSRERVLEKMKVFMDKVEAHYGQRPVIYTAPDFYADNLRGAFENYPFWLRAVAQHPSKVYPGRKWVFWQYSGSGLSQGVNGKIDLNVFRGSESEWWNWVGRQEAVASAD